MFKVETGKMRVKNYKNFFPTLILIIFFWSLLGMVVFFIDPETPAAVFIFFLLLFLAVLFSTSILFANTRRGILSATGTVFFFLLRYFGLGNVLNLLLIAGILISIDRYFLRD